MKQIALFQNRFEVTEEAYRELTTSKITDLYVDRVKQAFAAKKGMRLLGEPQVYFCSEPDFGVRQALVVAAVEHEK